MTRQSKLKMTLKMSINRLRMNQQKQSALAKQQRRSMAELLEQGKEESARIRVENIIREDINIELMEIMELYCELLLARMGLLEAKECDVGLEEAVCSIIYAAPRTQVRELQQVRDMLMMKFGKDFAIHAMENAGGVVPERVTKRLSVEPPSRELVSLYLMEIARAYRVPFSDLHDSDGSDGGDKFATPVAEDAVSAVHPDPTETEPPRKLPLRQPLRPKKVPSADDKELDDLRKRFDALKKL